MITELKIENPDGSFTEMVFVDNGQGSGYSTTKAYYQEYLASLETPETLEAENN